MAGTGTGTGTVDGVGAFILLSKTVEFEAVASEFTTVRTRR